MNEKSEDLCFFCQKEGVEGKKTSMNFSGIWIYKRSCPSCKEYFYSVGAEVHVKNDYALYADQIAIAKKALFLCKAERGFLEKELDGLRKSGYKIFWVPK